MTESETIDVSIIVVSYNTRELTLAALDSVYAETLDTSFEVIVVDNASSDGSADAIAGHPGRPQLIRLGTNIGFARANNLAALRAKGRRLLLLNPDTVVQGRAIDLLLAFARGHPEAGIWGGRTLFGDGRLNPSSCWGRMTPWRLFCRASGLAAVFKTSELCNGEAYGGWPRNRVREVDIVSGCFFLIERELWNRLNGFDPVFFMYGEEADLCLRARGIGARPMVTPAATIVHYGGASERARADKMVRLLAAKASLIERHFAPAWRSAGLLLHAAWPLSRFLTFALAARLSGHSAHAEAAATWGRIWRRRAEWRHGWPIHAAAPEASADVVTPFRKPAAGH